MHFISNFNKFERFEEKRDFIMGYATEKFSKRLKEIREASGLTQAQLASELKVSRGAISYYENGERTPDIEFLDSLAEYFDLPLEFAMGYTDNIKQEHRNMYEFYGLDDAACEELDRYPEIGQLISAILGHKSFYAIKKCYRSLLKNYKDFNFEQLSYTSFLISDALNKIVFDSLCILRDMQFTPEEKEALRIENEIALKEFDELTKKWNEEEIRRKKEWEKKDLELAKKDEEENSVQYKAQDNVYAKFYDGTESLTHKRYF